MNSVILILIIIVVIVVGLLLASQKPTYVGGNDPTHNQNGMVSKMPGGVLNWLFSKPNMELKNFENIDGQVQIYLEASDTAPEIIYFEKNENTRELMTKFGSTPSGDTIWKASKGADDFDSYIFNINDTYVGNLSSCNDDSWESLPRFLNIFRIDDDDIYDSPRQSVVDDALDTSSGGQTDRYILAVYKKIFNTGTKSRSTDKMADSIITYMDRGAYPVKLSTLELQNMRNAGILNNKNIALTKIKKYQNSGGPKLFTISDI